MKIQPQLLETRDDVADALRGKEGSIEWKADGWRLLAEKDAGQVRLFSRSGRDMTGHLPEIATVLEEALPDGTILDGEAVTVDDDWCGAQSVLGGYPSAARDRAAIRYAVWDVMSFAGSDTTRMPYKERRAFLETLYDELLKHVLIWLVPSVPATQEAYEALLAAGAEGGVVKLADSPYKPGDRGCGWFRVKPAPTLDVVAMDFVKGEGDRGETRKLGAIVFGQFKDGELVQRASCGTGFTDAQAQDIWERREKLIGKVFEVRYFGRAGDSECPRSPSFIRWRTDEKEATECEWEELQR
jgi:ATP-dependent DNA ligase